MRVAIGLIGLGLLAGVVPTGLPGVTHAAQVVAGTAGALLGLMVCCLAGAAVKRAAASSVAAAAPRLHRRPIATTQSAPRSI